MCMTCGCGQPNEKHGDNRNITAHDMDQAAQAAGISRQQVVRNMASSIQQLSAQPQQPGSQQQPGKQM